MHVTERLDLPGGTSVTELTAALRRTLERPALVLDAAEHSPVVHPITAPTTAFLSHVTVRAHDAEPLELAMIAKGLHSARYGLPPQIPAEERERIVAGIPWLLEAEVYIGDTADRMPSGVRLPRLYAAVEHADERLTLWLEDVDPLDTPWSAADLARAGTCLGRLTVRRSDQVLASLPTVQPFLDFFVENALRPWAIPQLSSDELWRHPAFAQPEVASLRRELAELAGRLDALHAALTAVPWHNTHGDPTPMNLLRPRHAPDTFVLIDWGTASRGPVGWDIVPLVFGPAENGTLPPADLADRLAVVVPAYEAGLAEEGMPVCDGAVASAVRAAALIRYPFTSLPLDDALQGVPVTKERMAYARRKAAFVRAVLDGCF